MLLVAALGAGAFIWWWSMHAVPHLQTLQIQGTPAQLLSQGEARQRVLLIAAPDQALDDATLQRLAEAGNLRLLQVPFVAGDCHAQQRLISQASEELGGAPTLVAGIGPAAASAWRWLAAQSDDQALALSVGFDLAKPDCAEPLPNKAEHGHWIALWNDNPGDDNARFLREQNNGEPRIGALGTPLPTLLADQLQHLLAGQGAAMPVIEHPSEQPADTLTLFYSGDGGWRDLDRASAEHMAAAGYPVVGIDTLRYYWQHKSPEQSAADLSRLMQQYRDKWHIKRFVLAGYSFGADVLPAIYNRLPASDQQQVDAMLLLAFARSGSFEIAVSGWLGKDGAEAATGPELRKVPAAKVYCIYGSEEAAESGCTEAGAPGEQLMIKGGHHFDGDYAALAQKMLAAIKARQPR
ncbi:virulence factor family protein [Pseudomonas sediminis]|nr:MULTISPECIES: AcvB/VirJ family lysyl-phosphatidylglycerol hydrolase [Pseudomonas]MDG9759358.1 virulence factor family protein [Pseudomonas sediminis]PKQ40216.1 virulence factor family protein [Pseudomonas sp. YY-1]